MKLLQDILYQTRIKQVVGNTNIAIEALCFDSREVKNFCLFVAVRGTQVDGHEFIEKAIESGAIAIVCEVIPEKKKEEIRITNVRQSH